MSEINLTVKKRELFTKGANNKLRKRGFVPGIFYSKGMEPIPIYASEGSLKPLIYTSETHIVNLKIDEGEEIKSILKDVDFDPVTDKIIHFDLLGIQVGQELELEVPVVLEGQAKGIKEGGVVQHQLHKLLVACLPKYIPEHITIDISNLGIGDSIHVKDIQIENVKVLNPPEVIVVSINIPRAAAVETATTAQTTTAEPSEPEVISKGKAEKEEE
ncbi:50S ribosomal protein L25 [Melioribacteraceae bacterium 4301-Me]|uniref:50S ribosomal protein L25 n=1 Tax=Pyranulibacter aquaticus TaxID=3163344 RepID=UPI00359BC86F